MEPDGRRAGVEGLLEAMEKHVLALHSRLRFLTGMQGALRSVSRGKSFAVWNHSVWSMTLDHRDMLITDLAALARATYGEDGYLGRLHACGGTSFQRRRARSAGEPGFSGKMLDALHSNAFVRLFPACAQKYASASDFDGLANWFFNVARPLMVTRDAVPVPPEQQLTGTADMLDDSVIESFIDATERMINDLRLVSLGTTVAFHAGPGVADHDAQNELVDMILHGSLARTAQLMGTGSREALYAAMHREHDQSPSGSLFNAPEVCARLRVPRDSIDS